MTNRRHAPTGELGTVSKVGAAEQSPGEPTGRLVTIEEFFTADPNESARVWHNIVSHFVPGGMLFSKISERPYFSRFQTECSDLNNRLAAAISGLYKEKGRKVFSRIENDQQLRRDLHDAYVKMKEFGGHDKDIFNFGFDTLKD